MDADDYNWQGPDGEISVRFNNNPANWGGLEQVAVIDGRTYFAKDASLAHGFLIGYLPKTSEYGRSATISVPTTWQSCESISQAAGIVRSLKLINDPERLRVVRIETRNGVAVATIVNEIGKSRDAKVGDSITRVGGTVKSIMSDRVVIQEYVWGSGWHEFSQPLVH